MSQACGVCLMFIRIRQHSRSQPAMVPCRDSTADEMQRCMMPRECHPAERLLGLGRELLTGCRWGCRMLWTQSRITTSTCTT